MRAARTLIAFVGAALSASGTAAGACREDASAGACFSIHGRLAAGKGSSAVRLWIVGTQRTLALSPDDPAQLEPACLREDVADGKRLYADFVVCPLAPDRAGTIRPMCIQSASHRIVEEPNGDARAVAAACTAP